MMHRPLFACLLLIAALSAGCSTFKKSAPKESSAPAAETEQLLRQRWVDKRAAELVAQGVADAAARTQALAEFRERYGFTGAAQK
jgi:PBP1b-binding outer membrane lipoprotein LpoB